MRKVVLTMYENHQYQKVKRCVDQNGNFMRLCCQVIPLFNRFSIFVDAIFLASI